MTPNTILVRARDLEVHLGDADDVRVVRGDERVRTRPHALAVLAAFAHPRAVADVLAGAAAGSQDWIELSSTIHELATAGILLEECTTDTRPRGYARPSIDIVMLDDHARTRGFIDALKAVVRKEDAVLDIGTGTGVLATAAALAGAARVVAVESSAIADSADRVFADNGVADRVTLVRGRSTKITLPERCDVLVTEMIGNDPLDEQLLEIVDDAKKRLLTAGARLIPAAIEVFAVAVDLPRRFYERRAFTRERLDEWREMYGVDFSPLMSERPTAAQPFSVRTREILTWQPVATPVSVTAVDLTRPFELAFCKRISFVLERDAKRLGIALAFRATLAPGIVLSTLLDEVDTDNHWRYAVWPAFERLSVASGTTVTLDYAYGRGVTTLSVS